MTRELSKGGNPVIITNWQVTQSIYKNVVFGTTRQKDLESKQLNTSKENGLVIRGHVYDSPPSYLSTWHVDICMSDSDDNCAKCTIEPAKCPIKAKIISRTA